MKQYICNNVTQVAYKVAELTNTKVEKDIWKNYCYTVKKEKSTDFIDYTAFDDNDIEYDVSIMLGYDTLTKSYVVGVDYEDMPV